MNMTMEKLGFFFNLPFLFLMLSFLLLIIIIITKTNKTRNRKVPPGPWRLPIIGNLHLLDPNKPHRSLINLSNKHGPLILLHLGSIPTLVVSSRDIAKEIFTNHDLTFSNRPILTAPKKLLYNCDISFSPYGDHWRQARKIAMLELLSSRRIRSLEAVRREEVEKLLVTIKDLSTANLSELMLSFANNTVCRAAFGDELGDGGYFRKGGVWLHELLSETQSLLGGFCVADFFPRMEWIDRLRGFHGRLEKNFEKIDQLFDTLIRDLLEMSEKEEACGDVTKDGDEEEKDLLHVLLRLHKAAILHGGYMSSVEHVKAILVETYIAGTDTISATIIWTMTQLIRNPRVMMKLQEELMQVVTNGNSHRLIQERELKNLEYLKQVIKESLRLKPPVPLLLPHETIKACEIQGYMIPACTRVIFNAAAISLDPNIWEKPLEFWPERFEGRDIDFRGHDFELLPFGSGRRVCPGINFATVIIELVLANLLHRFTWSTPDGMKAEDINMEEAIGVTKHKKVALCLVAKSKW